MMSSLFAIMARRAPVAVIFRRGPSKQVLLVKWHLDTDKLEYGQWLKGRIYERRCDLSPSGNLLIYFAASFKPPLYSWTAISKPPFLTALALWPKGDTWGGGGVFDSEASIQLNHRHGQEVLADGFRLKINMLIAPYGSRSGGGEDFPIYHTLLLRNGWTFIDPRKAGKTDQRGKTSLPFIMPIIYERSRPAAAGCKCGSGGAAQKTVLGIASIMWCRMKRGNSYLNCLERVGQIGTIATCFLPKTTNCFGYAGKTSAAISTTATRP